MNFKIFQWRSLKTRVTLTTPVIFLTGIWSLALYVGATMREDLERLLCNQKHVAAALTEGKTTVNSPTAGKRTELAGDSSA